MLLHYLIFEYNTLTCVRSTIDPHVTLFATQDIHIYKNRIRTKFELFSLSQAQTKLKYKYDQGDYNSE